MVGVWRVGMRGLGVSGGVLLEVVEAVGWESSVVIHLIERQGAQGVGVWLWSITTVSISSSTVSLSASSSPSIMAVSV